MWEHPGGPGYRLPPPPHASYPTLQPTVTTERFTRHRCHVLCISPYHSAHTLIGAPVLHNRGKGWTPAAATRRKAGMGSTSNPPHWKRKWKGESRVVQRSPTGFGGGGGERMRLETVGGRVRGLGRRKRAAGRPSFFIFFYFYFSLSSRRLHKSCSSWPVGRPSRWCRWVYEGVPPAPRDVFRESNCVVRSQTL